MCATFHYFATEKKDCTAIGILQLIYTKRFLISLYLLNAALKHLNKLSMLFQKGSFNFSHIQSALTICQNEIRNFTDLNHVVNSLKLDWNKIAKILPNSQNELLEDDIELIKSTTKIYCEALIQNLEDDIELIKSTTKIYCEALIHNLDDCFPESEVLFDFRIFDVKEIPLDAYKRQLYGNHNLQLLISRFLVTGTSAEQVLKVQNDYQTLKDRMVMPEFEFCKDAGEVCSKIARDQIFQEIFPELHWFCCIALSIPLATAWPRRGFSTFCRVKNKQRNRLLGATLNALMTHHNSLTRMRKRSLKSSKIQKTKASDRKSVKDGGIRRFGSWW